MVAIFRMTSGHPFYAVANSKEEAINVLYERFAHNIYKKWYTPMKWWDSMTNSNEIEPFEIRECEVLK